MTVTISPSNISGNIYAPASKSCMQRACAAALLSNGKTIIHKVGKSNDDLVALNVIKRLGATVTLLEEDKLIINSKGFPKSVPLPSGMEPAINCGESGLCLRMFAPIAALSNHEIILTGSGSLLQRPMHFFDQIFPQLNISIQSNNGKLPIKIKGPLIPANITIDGSLSSQYLTGLLMAYAKACTTQVNIKVKNLKSKPYIDLTLQVMKYFGWYTENKNYEEFFFKPTINHQLFPKEFLRTTINYVVEGDWSSSSFLMVAAAINGNITIEGLDINSTQADKAIVKALKLSGADISFAENKFIVQSNNLKPFHFNATDYPDLFPPLVALASYCNGQSTIEGVHRLAHKESNRAIALKEEFGKMGIQIRIQDDVMIIEGGTKIKGAHVHSHHDHRIVMACVVAALQADGDTIIHDAEAVNKSYPDFFDHLKSLNIQLRKT